MTNVSLYFIAILILISFIIIGGIVIIIIFAARKKKINKKLQEDNINISNGKEPSGAGRHESAVLPIISFIIAIVAIVLSLIVYINSQINYLKNDIYNSNIEIDMLSNEIETIKLELKKERSILSSFTISKIDNSFNSETMTENLEIQIIPKEISNDTIVSIIIDNIVYTATKDNDKYIILYAKDIFSSIDNDVIVKIETNGITKTEMIDSSLYRSIYLLTSPTWGSTLPNISAINFYTDYEYDRFGEINKNKYTIDSKMDIEIKKNESTVTSFKVNFYDGTKVLTEKDLTSSLKDMGKYYKINELHINETFTNIESNYVDMVWEITEANGWTLYIHERTFKSGYDYTIPYYTITSSNGTTYNFK